MAARYRGLTPWTARIGTGTPLPPGSTRIARKTLEHAKNTPGLVLTGTRFVRHDTYLPIEGLRKTLRPPEFHPLMIYIISARLPLPYHAGVAGVRPAWTVL